MSAGHAPSVNATCCVQLQRRAKDGCRGLRFAQPRCDEIVLNQGNIKRNIVLNQGNIKRNIFRVLLARTGLSGRLPNALSPSRGCAARRHSKYSPQGRFQTPIITIYGSAAIGSKEASTRKVIVTRELGKNGKLVAELSKLGIESIELPLIEHAHGEDRSQLPRSLREENWDWIVVTSPEAATVFLEAWEEAGKPNLNVAAVGGGTAQSLEERIKPKFTPSKATAVTLAAELPGDCGRVLYPASAKASSDLQIGLSNRGFEVVRLNTYTTLPVSNIDEDTLQDALKADVVTFASPSAVKAWVKIAGLKTHQPIACIGETSANAAARAGFSNIHYPEKPGIAGWVNSIEEALCKMSMNSTP